MSEKIRILWIHPRLRDYRKSLFDLMSQKYDIRFLFGKKNPELEDSYNSIYLRNIRASFKKLLNIKETKILCKEIKSADIVISSFLSNKSTLIALLLIKIFKKRLIVWEEQHYFHQKFIKRIKYFLHTLMAKKVDAFYVMGHPQKDALKKIGVPSSKIFIANEYSGIIYNQIDEKPFDIGINPQKNHFFLYIGRLIEIKGLDLLINAFKKLSDDNIHLIIAGSGKEEIHLRHIAKGDNRIKFVGQVNDIENKAYLFKNADALVLPSKITSGKVVEAGGIVILEALSAGLPVIAAIGANIQFIKDGITGYKFKVGDSNDLKDKLKIALMKKKRGEMQREKVIEEFKKIPGYQSQCNVLEKAIRSALQ